MLRALDTVEDDMTIPNDEKIPMLRQFHTYLQDPEWKYIKSQEKDRRVLEDFPVVGICILYSIIPSILDIRQHFHDQVSGRDDFLLQGIKVRIFYIHCKFFPRFE